MCDYDQWHGWAEKRLTLVVSPTVAIVPEISAECKGNHAGGGLEKAISAAGPQGFFNREERWKQRQGMGWRQTVSAVAYAQLCLGKGRATSPLCTTAHCWLAVGGGIVNCDMHAP